jgi:hypothetical protein
MPLEQISQAYRQQSHQSTYLDSNNPIASHARSRVWFG